MVDKEQELKQLIEEYNQLKEKKEKDIEIREMRRKIRHLKYGFMSKLGAFLYSGTKKTGNTLSRYANNIAKNIDEQEKRPKKYTYTIEEDYFLR